jgi:hypothetical protein
VRLSCGDNFDATGQEILDDRDQMAQASPKTIQPPDEDTGEATSVGIR